MKLQRRQFLQLTATAAALPAVSRFASAESYPARPVHLLEGFGAGGAPDVVARLIGQSLSEQLGQSFVPIPGEAARRSGMMPPTDSEMISPAVPR